MLGEGEREHDKLGTRKTLSNSPEGDPETPVPTS